MTDPRGEQDRSETDPLEQESLEHTAETGEIVPSGHWPDNNEDEKTPI